MVWWLKWWCWFWHHEDDDMNLVKERSNNLLTFSFWSSYSDTMESLIYKFHFLMSRSRLAYMSLAILPRKEILELPSLRLVVRITSCHYDIDDSLLRGGSSWAFWSTRGWVLSGGVFTTSPNSHIFLYHYSFTVRMRLLGQELQQPKPDKISFYPHLLEQTPFENENYRTGQLLSEHWEFHI